MGHASTKEVNKEHAVRLLRQAASTGGIGATALGRQLGVSTKTARRYLDELSTRYMLKDDGSGHYWLDPSQFLPNLVLSAEEALAVFLALRRLIRQSSQAPAFFGTAIEHVGSVLRPAALSAQLTEASVQLEAVRRADADQEHIWSELVRGWLDGVPVRLKSRNWQTGKESTHIFEPFLFEPSILGHGIYVIGWSQTRQEIRTFKISRLTRANRTSGCFTQSPDLHVDELLKHAWGIIYGDETHKVTLRFSAKIAPVVQETVWHPSEKVEEQDDGALLWQAEVASLLELISFIRGWGPDVEVLAPAELRERIAASLREAAAQYDALNKEVESK